MATTLYTAKAAVVKVSVGPATGNRVARIIRAGGIIPEGVEKDQIARLVKLGLIEKITVPTAEEIAAQQEADAKAAADAKAKADADTKAAAEAKAKADADAKAAAAKK